VRTGGEEEEREVGGVVERERRGRVSRKSTGEWEERKEVRGWGEGRGGGEER